MRNLTLIIVLLLFVAGASAQPNYIIKPKDIFDFGMYANSDPNQPQNWFDGFGHLDPKNGITSYSGNKWDTSKGQPDKLYDHYFQSGLVDRTFYPGNRGCRVVFDLTGMKDMLDTTHKFVLTDIYGYTQTYDAGNTLYFYNFDKVMRYPMNERMKYIARPDSLLTPFDSLTTLSTPGRWLRAIVNDSMRYLLVRMVKKNSKTAEFAELVLYGHHNYDPVALAGSVTPERYTGPLPSHKTPEYAYGKVVGTVHLQGVDTLQMNNNGPVRTYVGANYFDTTNTKNYTNFRFWTSPDVGPAQLGYYKRRGQKMWYTNQGSSAYMSNHGNNGWNIDDFGLEPESMTSYNRSSDLLFNLAAKYGSVAVPASQTKWVGDNGYPNGLGLMSVMENGNEVEAHGGTYVADFCKTSADYDAIKADDPNMVVLMSGMVAPDSNKVKVFYLLSKLCRPGGKFPADVINFHKYFSNRDSLPIGQTFDYNLQVGMQAETPEQVGGSGGMLKMFDDFARNVYKYVDTSHKIILTENGQGNYPNPAATVGEAAAVWDIYCTPAFGTYTNLQAKAIYRARIDLLMPFTPVAWYNQYAQSNQYGDPNNNHYELFYSYGDAAGRDSRFSFNTFFPSWYYKACFYSNLQNYYPDAIVVNGGPNGMWQVRYRHINYPDSICNVVWKGSRNGSSLNGQSIAIGSVLGNSLTKIVPSFTQVAGTVSTVAVVGGVLTADVDERPFMYFGKEDASTNVPPVARAGNDISITLPVNYTTLDGTASSDADGAIISYAWSYISGPAQYNIVNNAAASTTLNNLAQGIYTFRLFVTDNRGATAADTIQVTVNPGPPPPPNVPPVARAGNDIVITLPVAATTLDGSASTDSDGSIVSYTWSKIGGPASFNIVNTGIATTPLNTLAQGVYLFRLEVADNTGATAADTIQVTVNAAPPPPANVPPVARAGNDIVITMPVVATTLDGNGSTDSDGSIISYTWSKISGPASFNIVNTGIVTTALNTLTQGVYLFRLQVADNAGATAADTVQVTVNAALPPPPPPVNKPPVAKAGKDTTISYPLATVTLNGSASYDPDGTIKTYTWRQIKGVVAAAIVQPGSAITLAEQLAPGIFEFELTVTDNNNAVAKDTVAVTVVSSLRYTGAIKVYPNPVADELTIDALNDITGKVLVTVYDITGKQVQENTFDKQASVFRQQMNVAALAKGTYVLRVLFLKQEIAYTFKLAKQ